MTISRMSLKKAAVIEDLYTGLWSKQTLEGKFKFFKYSDVDDFDFIDILNAFKILTAYKIFKSKTPEDIQEIKEYVNLAGGLLVLFPLHFGPDEIAEKINDLDKNNKSSIIEFANLRQEIPKNEEWDNSETLSSFMYYLLGLERKDNSFWEKAFDRIGISWDKNDTEDEITFIIDNKDCFFHNTDNNKDYKQQNEPEELKQEKKSIYRQHKYFFDQTFTFTLLGLSIFFPIIRVLVFSILALFTGLKLYFWLQEPIKQKIKFFINILEFFLFAGAIFLSSLTLYAIGFAIFTTIVDIVRGADKDYNAS
jgi:hypothetical protein